jgi:hypothetical protein
LCGLCGVLAGAEHWSDGVAGATGGTPTQRRQVRNRIANTVLEYYGLKLRDTGGGSALLQNQTGASTVVPHLGALWPAAERLAGRRCDPLDPELVAALMRSRSPGA